VGRQSGGGARVQAAVPDVPGAGVPDRAAWQTLRRQLDERAETRRAQRRFRKDPDRYLAALEARLLQ
jgi:hypothetical protein